ncbi:hypothetical protein [Nonlabens sp.]|uniref:hypothetical protein n=1 Tax=Nonlabens sp. TaxID=1888209 RepID=UPI0032671BBA
MKNSLLVLFTSFAFSYACAQDQLDNFSSIDNSFLVLNETVIDDVNSEEYLTIINAPATRKYSYNNRIGLGGDATFFNIDSDKVQVNQGTGWSASLETRGDFRDDFDMIYSIGIFNHNFSVNENITNDQIDMSVIGAEVKFLLAWKIAQSDFFSIEAGPALQLNGELKIDDEDRYENSFTGGLVNPIILKDFQETSPINVNGIIGFSGGARNFRVTAHYHYSFIDALAGTTVSGDNIDGNFSFISVGGRLYF